MRAAHPHPAGAKPLPVRRASTPRTSPYSRSMGNSSPLCFASRPCGVCIVACCSFCVGEERECRACQNFDPPSLRLGFFLSCEMLAWRHRGPKEAPARGQPSRGATLPGNAACGSTAHNNSGHCWRTCMVVANNVQTRSNGLDDRGQPLVTMGGGALPLPMPTQPETLTATRVATKATSTFFIGVPLSFTSRDSHFVPRCTVSRPLNPMVHRLRRQWGISKGTVSLGTQLPSRPVAMCLWAGRLAR